MHLRLKSLLVNIFKFSFSAALIYWLIKSDKISFEPFKLMLEKSWLIPLVLLSGIIMTLINNYRWWLLMRGQKLHSGLFQTLRLTFIGLFFNLVVPGSVGGDVFKAYYVSKDHVGSKIKAVTSILIDRILGLYAISLIAFFAIIFEWQTIMASGRLKSLAFFIFSLTFAFSLFFALGFSRRIRKHKFINFILKKVPGGGFIEKAYDAVHAFRHGKKEFIIGIGLSLISQGQMVYILFVIAKQLHFITTIGECFFVIPVGFMATAIPISPAGIGVGQVVFYKLFHWYSGVDSSLGPTLITINQLCFVFLGLIGAISYLFYKGKGKKHG